MSSTRNLRLVEVPERVEKGKFIASYKLEVGSKFAPAPDRVILIDFVTKQGKVRFCSIFKGSFLQDKKSTGLMTYGILSAYNSWTDDIAKDLKVTNDTDFKAELINLVFRKLTELNVGNKLHASPVIFFEVDDKGGDLYSPPETSLTPLINTTTLERALEKVYPNQYRGFDSSLKKDSITGENYSFTATYKQASLGQRKAVYQISAN